MKKHRGFTIVELVMFIIITGLLANSILLALSMATVKTPITNQQTIATQTAKRCMEWFIGQRRLNGYASLPCPSTSTPSFCVAPSGYTISASVSCTTIGGDANYKTITVTIGGQGDAALSLLIAAY